MTRAIRLPRRPRSTGVRGVGRDSWPLPRRLRRRGGEPGSDAAAGASSRLVRGRLAHVSVLASMRAGAWAGLVLGLVLGGPLGAAVAWLAGAIVGWQRDLSLTLGLARNLLPFGDQIGVLRTISTNWLLVVPGVALVTAAVTAVVLSLVGGILAAASNATGGHASIVVDLTATEGATLDADDDLAAHAAAEPDGESRPDAGD